MIGACTKVNKQLLQEMLEALTPQSHSVQERERQLPQTGEAQAWLQAIEGCQWTGHARVQEEGEDDEEDNYHVGVLEM